MFDPKAFDWRGLQARLMEALSLVSEPLSATGYPERAGSIRDLIRSGEEGIALESLCSNLYEFDVPVPASAYALLQEAGQAMNGNGAGLSAETWECLKPLVVG